MQMYSLIHIYFYSIVVILHSTHMHTYIICTYARYCSILCPRSPLYEALHTGPCITCLCCSETLAHSETYFSRHFGNLWLPSSVIICMSVCVCSQVRTAVGVASIGGFLFAVGGECEGSRSYEPTQYLESVECYDPKTNAWSEKAKMSQPRSFAAVAVLNGKLLNWNGIHVLDIVCSV